MTSPRSTFSAIVALALMSTKGANADAVRGDAGTNFCPTGSTPMTESQCLQYASEIGEEFSKEGRNDMPGNCFWRGVLNTENLGGFNGVYFNTASISSSNDPIGAENDNAQPICVSTAGTEGDPHTTGLHGEHFDVHGKHGAVINLLSAKNVSLNARVEEHAFNVFNLKVYGSFFVAMFFTLRTNFSGRMTNLEYDPRYPPTLFDKRPLTVGTKIVEMEDVRLLHENPDSIQLNTSAWSFTIMAKTIEYGVVQSWMIKQRHTAIKQLRLDLIPLTDPLQHGIAPHGIIGQTADGDDEAIDGEQDDLAELAKTAEKGPGGLKSVHPTAQGEGAIEGTIDDYIVLGNVFETKFKYSRFDATSAPVRDTSKLTGTRRARTSGSAGASGDDSIPGDQALESA